MQHITHRNQFGQFLNLLRLTGVGVEVGVHLGHFSDTILNEWKGKKLWLVDPWKHLDDYLDSFNASDAVMQRRFERTQIRLRPWQKKVRYLRELSVKAAKHFDKESCDFVYIDGNHSFSHVQEDLRLWYPKVKRGGVFAGHDYFDAVADKDLEPIFCDGVAPEKLTSYGTKSAVHEFAAKTRLELFLTREKLTKTQFPTWYFIKR